MTLPSGSDAIALASTLGVAFAERERLADAAQCFAHAIGESVDEQIVEIASFDDLRLTEFALHRVVVVIRRQIQNNLQYRFETDPPARILVPGQHHG